MNPKEQQCYWIAHDREISMKDDVACSWKDGGYVIPANEESRLVMVQLEPSAEEFIR